MPHRYLLRHGESTANLERIYAGWTDVPLTKTGRSQARKAALEIKRTPIDVIYSSPLSRALETARIVATEIGIKVSEIVIAPDLTERDLGNFSGKSRDDYDIAQADKKEFNIETDQSLYKRIKRQMDALPRDKNVLIVSHQGAGKMIRAVVANRDWQKAMENENVPNCHIVEL